MGVDGGAAVDVDSVDVDGAVADLAIAEADSGPDGGVAVDV